MKNQTWKSKEVRRRFLRVLPFLFCGVMGLTGRHSTAQALTPPSADQPVEAALVNLFHADLKILAHRLGIAFVAEGQPFPIVKDGPVPTLNANLTREEAIKEIADYFDYAVVRQGEIYLLTKRYTAPQDLLEVTPDECLFGLKAVSKVLAPFNPNIPSSTIAGNPEAAIVHLLSAEQIAKFGQNGLPVSELTPAQRAEAWRLALKFYLQSEAEHLDETITTLENRNPRDPVFHWQTIKNIYAFGYDTRSEHLNKIVFIPISNSNQIVVLPNGATAQITRVHKHNGVVVPDKDPTDPTDLTEAIKQLLDHPNRYPSYTVSLSEAVAALNKRPQGHMVYKVDTMYAAKRVTLVGMEKFSPEITMRSLAAVYGLRAVHTENSNLILTHPVLPNVKEISDLRQALQEVIPAPILHAMRPLSQTPPPGQKGIERPILASEYQARGSAIHRAAMQMFRYVAEATVKSQSKTKRALSQFDEPERLRFALSSTVGSFAQACWMTDRPVPPYIGDFDHVILTGGISHTPDGSAQLSLFFSYRNPQSGLFYKGVGFINAPVP